MTIQTRDYAYGTSLTVRYPWGINVSGRAMCPDGVVRRLSRIAQTADTAFSIPAAVKAHGKTVSGYVTFETRSRLSCDTPEDPMFLVFRPVDTAKNADAVFPNREFISADDLEFSAKYGTPAKSKLVRF